MQNGHLFTIDNDDDGGDYDDEDDNDNNKNKKNMMITKITTKDNHKDTPKGEKEEK